MRMIRLALLVGTGLAILFTPPVLAQSIVGQWKLVEQTYGEGKSNLLEDDAKPFRIEFFRDGADLEARIRVGDSAATSLSWPRLSVDDARATRVTEKRVARGESGAFVRYRVDPSPGDDLVLEVTEEYRLGADAQTLDGTIRVHFERDGEDRGSYVLHRRFVREP